MLRPRFGPGTALKSGSSLSEMLIFRLALL